MGEAVQEEQHRDSWGESLEFSVSICLNARIVLWKTVEAAKGIAMTFCHYFVARIAGLFWLLVLQAFFGESERWQHKYRKPRL